MSDLFSECVVAIMVASVVGLLSMEAFVQDEFFPVVERKRSKLSNYLAAVREHGPIAPCGMVAAFLDVSRSRVYQLISEGRLAAVTVNGQRYVPVAALELFATEERKVGRPFKQPSFADLMRGGLQKS